VKFYVPIDSLPGLIGLSRRLWRCSGKWLAALVALLCVESVQAVPVTVQPLSVDPAQIVTIDLTDRYTGAAYAGVVNLMVGGIATPAFCIDPYHFSDGTIYEYEIVSLASAPKAYSPIFDGQMGELKASQISKLWAMAYSDSLTASQAAALQIAIWEIVGGDLFAVIGEDYGADDLLVQLNSYEGPAANLIALTGPGQDYVVAQIPDFGATALLFGLSIGMIGVLANALQPRRR
jgi:hypothetical protein